MSQVTSWIGRSAMGAFLLAGATLAAGPAWAGCIPVTEIVNNGIDEDCDGVDSCYRDADNDNWGVPVIIDSLDLDCADNFEAGVTGDCNDGNAAVHPGAVEIVGNSNDEDCNGQERCYQDNDNDDYGTSTQITSTDVDCFDNFEASNPSDCNDANASVNPGATEIVANNVDDNCNGQELCYQDADNDDFGTSATVTSADADCLDALEAMNTTDCNDGSATVHPGAMEIVANNIDEDCNGQERCYQDNDNDNFGTFAVINSSDADCLDAFEAMNSTDCNDSNASAYPGAVEIVANGIDEDCNGQERCYRDNDNDDYGTLTQITSTDLDCLDALEATNSTDCNDGNAAIYPGAVEVCNSQDDDCDSQIDEFAAPGAVPTALVLGPVMAGSTVLSWPSVPTATVYDVVMGSLVSLAGSSGDFTAATTGCQANNAPTTSTSDFSVPPTGDGFWYLVRAVNCSTPGTYESGTLSQVGLRDPEIAATPARCP